VLVLRRASGEMTTIYGLYQYQPRGASAAPDTYSIRCGTRLAVSMAPEFWVRQPIWRRGILPNGPSWTCAPERWGDCVARCGASNMADNRAPCRCGLDPRYGGKRCAMCATLRPPTRSITLDAGNTLAGPQRFLRFWPTGGARIGSTCGSMGLIPCLLLLRQPAAPETLVLSMVVSASENVRTDRARAYGAKPTRSLFKMGIYGTSACIRTRPPAPLVRHPPCKPMISVRMARRLWLANAERVHKTEDFRPPPLSPSAPPPHLG